MFFFLGLPSLSRNLDYVVGNNSKNPAIGLGKITLYGVDVESSSSLCVVHQQTMDGRRTPTSRWQTDV